jgi:hypothetical protein
MNNLLVLLAVVLGTFLSQAVAAADDPGFVSLFDGQTLQGWHPGDPSYWTVEDGAITARITKDHPGTVNQYLVWQGGELADFELKLESRLNGEGAINNGFQYRSRLLPDGDVCGYQMDNNLETPWLVRLYDEYGRHDLALRGERATFDADGNRTVAPLPEAAGDAWFRLEDWHEYHLVCVGGQITLYVNGRIAAEIQDNDPRRAEPQGIFALQLHSGPPTEVQFRNIRLKVLKPATEPPQAAESPERAALRGSALAWWALDSAGRGAAHPLTSVPQFYQLQLNVASAGPGAVPGAKCVVLEGAYFDAGTGLLIEGEQLTVYLRARDLGGAWNAALFGKGAGENAPFRLFAGDVDGDGAGDLAFEVATDQGRATVHFPVAQLDATAWHDVVGRYDGKEVAIFCGGQRMAATPCSGMLVRTDAPLLIAAESAKGEIVRHFHGELEDAAIWPRALGDGEVAALSR